MTRPSIVRVCLPRFTVPAIAIPVGVADGGGPGKEEEGEGGAKVQGSERSRLFTRGFLQTVTLRARAPGRQPHEDDRPPRRPSGHRGRHLKGFQRTEEHAREPPEIQARTQEKAGARVHLAGQAMKGEGQQGSKERSRAGHGGDSDTDGRRRLLDPRGRAKRPLPNSATFFFSGPSYARGGRERRGVDEVPGQGPEGSSSGRSGRGSVRGAGRGFPLLDPRPGQRLGRPPPPA